MLLTRDPGKRSGNAEAGEADAGQYLEEDITPIGVPHGGVKAQVLLNAHWRTERRRYSTGSECAK